MHFFAILEWSITNRKWQILESDSSARAQRSLRMRFNVLKVRYPNNSFRFVDFGDGKVIEEHVVHHTYEDMGK